MRHNRNTRTTMHTLMIPSDYEDITLEWLNEAIKLGATYEIGNTNLVSFKLEKIGQDFGFVNRLARLKLKYDNEVHNLPNTLILKLPPSDINLKMVHEKLNNAKKEFKFYQLVSSNGILGVPAMYYGAVDYFSGRSVLLLEDISYYRQGDSVSGCSYDEACIALTQLAKFQSKWWMKNELKYIDWMPVKINEIQAYEELYQDAWRSFVDMSAGNIPVYLHKIGEKLGENISSIKTTLSRDPLTIVHGDYRLDNCFFGFENNLGSPVIKVIDWENCVKGRGTYDVATFISEAFPIKQRQAIDEILLKVYHSCLLDNGIDDYTFEECLKDYRLSMLEILIFWIVSGGYGNYKGDRASVYLKNSLERFSNAIRDLGSEDLLRG